MTDFLKQYDKNSFLLYFKLSIDKIYTNMQIIGKYDQ